MNNKFNIGDVVQITDMDGNYPHYSKMAQHMNLDNFMVGENCPTNTNLEIVAAKDHLEFYEVVYGVRDIATGKEYLVGDDFMVLVEPSSQYTLDDLRNKYVRVGTPEYEAFMDACDGLDVTWSDGKNCREIPPYSVYVGYDVFAGLSYSLTSEAYGFAGFNKFIPKQPQHEVAEETPWTIYNNTLPMYKLTDEQAVELFVAWRKGGVILETLEGVTVETHPTWEHSSVYAIKCKSDSDLFVEKMLTFYNNDVIDDKVVDMLKEAYDNGCRFV